jgi:hypothetical protein
VVADCLQERRGGLDIRYAVQFANAQQPSSAKMVARRADRAREAQFVVSIWKLGTPTMLMTREASPPSKDSVPDCASDSFARRTS